MLPPPGVPSPGELGTAAAEHREPHRGVCGGPALPTWHCRLLPGSSRAGLRTQSGSSLQQHWAPLFPLAPTQSLLNPHPPSLGFQSPSGLASGHLFFMSTGRHWRSMAGKGSAGRRCCLWAGWLGQSRAAPQPLPFPPAPKCSCDADVGLRAHAVSKTIALHVLMFI